MNKDQYTTPDKCPLCSRSNYCGNLSSSANGTCWCMDKNIGFPDDLLNQATDAAKNKACICKACALKHKQAGSKST